MGIGAKKLLISGHLEKEFPPIRISEETLE
ncbi:MAG: hypothetical protein CM1200mP10_19440 [Candidatus Neomarinimicrobiota bacterium]|nr:MAG: hypothetical protein CM1200mP10_19440 [Candidatus Neomarinimicrobiota bacterium]